MTVALAMTACSSDDNSTETPQAPSTSKIIDYTVTVNDGAATTRATVDSDNKTLKFAEGDKLYITGTNIKGVLNIQTGATTNSATFSGDLTFSGSGTPASDLSLTATLVSAQQTVGTQVSVDDAGAVTVNYPTTAYCADVATAVQKYSRLTGTSTYGAKSFTLNQQTAFLNFVITLTDGTATSTVLSAVVNNNSSNICTANVTTETWSGKVVAKFVLPVAKGLVMNSATVKVGTMASHSFGGSKTLEGKVYYVNNVRTLNLINPTVGQVIGNDGKNYDANASLPSGVTAVAKICYVDGVHGLALALTDETVVAEDNWSSARTNAINACSGKNSGEAAITGASWMLPSQGQWETMIGSNYSYFRSITNLSNSYYWSSTENGTQSRIFEFQSSNYVEHWDNAYDHDVRACLVF